MPVPSDRDDRPGWQILDLSGEPASPASARHWVEARLGALGEPHRIDTLLVAGELLENAYQHAGGAIKLRLHRRLDPCEVTVAVVDTGSGSPRLRVPDEDGGRGLRLVDRVCLDWGVRYHDDSKVVWGRIGCAAAEVPCPRKSSSGSGWN